MAEREVNIEDPLEVALYLGMLCGIRYLTPQVKQATVDHLAHALYNIQTVPAAILVDGYREGVKSVRAKLDPKLAEERRVEIDQLEKMLPQDDQPEAAA